MPVYQELLDLNQKFAQLTEPPIIINDLFNDSVGARENIRELITTRYSSDMISLMPSCRCGATKGEFSKNTLCLTCNTPVKSAIESDIEPIVWFRKPNGVQKLLNPMIWMMLSNRFKKGQYSLINWIVDTKYNPNVKQPVAIINKMMQAGIQQGYNYFVENFDEIMEFMFSLKDFKAKQDDRLYELIQRERDRIFSDFIPIPNKSILIVEKTNFSTYVDEIITNAVNAIQMLVSIDRDFYDQTARAKENRTARAMSMLCDFYLSYFSDNVSSKQGQFRRHIFGSRTNFSFRAVITSITGPHDYLEIEVPWGVGLTVFREHLLNKLSRLGLSMNQAVGMIYEHIEKYNPLLDKLLQEIIAEFPGGRCPLLLNRNPSLLQGSILALNVRTIKKNPKDRTIGLSILVTRLLNADFDGDEVNVSLLLDNKMAAECYPLEPKFSIYDMNQPLSISSDCQHFKMAGRA
jgi:hypothetical protein